MIKKILSIVLFLLFFAPFLISINKVFLKYKRDVAIQYAEAHWYHINEDSGYKNYGDEFPDGLTPTKKTWGDCSYYGVLPLGVSNCGGDCANFVSQCLIAGGINAFELTQNVERRFVATDQLRETIANAEEIGNRLVNMGAKDSISGSISSSNLQPGDVIVVPQGKSHHALIVAQGEKTRDLIQVYGHSPLSQAGVSPKGILGNWNENAARLIHIPDVPCVRIVSIYKKSEGGQKAFYYDTYLDESKNGGDGEMPILERRIKQ